VFRRKDGGGCQVSSEGGETGPLGARRNDGEETGRSRGAGERSVPFGVQASSARQGGDRWAEPRRTSVRSGEAGRDEANVRGRTETDGEQRRLQAGRPRKCGAGQRQEGKGHREVARLSEREKL
jgi:hypothetical protein